MYICRLGNSIDTKKWNQFGSQETSGSSKTAEKFKDLPLKTFFRRGGIGAFKRWFSTISKIRQKGEGGGSENETRRCLLWIVPKVDCVIVPFWTELTDTFQFVHIINISAHSKMKHPRILLMQNLWRANLNS